MPTTPMAATYRLLTALCCALGGCWLGPGVGADPQVFHVPREHLPISAIAVHPESGQVYVGGSNYLARLSPDLTPLQSVSLKDEAPGNGSVSDWPRVQVLEIFPRPERLLLVCWQEARCQCRTHDLENITVMRDVSMVNLTCGKHSLVVKRDESRGAGESDLLLAAPWNKTKATPVLSFLALCVNGCPEMPSLSFALNRKKGRSHFLGQGDHSYLINFVHGFVYESFTYLVTVQDNDLFNEKVKVSKIARVCNNHSSVLPYTETDLMCVVGNEHFTIASAARLARIPSGEETVDVLVVSFVKSTDALGDPRADSAICVYEMRNIKTILRGIGSSLLIAGKAPWVSIDHGKKEKVENECEGNVAKRGEGSTKNDTVGILVLHLSGEVVTSMHSDSLQGTSANQREVFLLFTSQGLLKEFNMTSRTYTLEWKPNRTYNLTTTPATWSNAGIYGSYVYVSTNDTVYRETWSLFPDILDCEMCVEDSSRQWCQGGCHLFGSTSCREHLERTCPPHISQIEPAGGLKAGGTVLTISGSRLGVNKENVNVTICGKPCIVSSINLTRVLCETPKASPGSYVCSVTYTVNESSSNASRISFRGKDTAQQNFTYEDPVLTTLRPWRGPQSGGTQLTIASTGLRPQYNVSVFLSSGAQCQDARATETHVTCTTPLLGGEELEEPVRVNVTAVVDGHNFTGNTSFQYEKDPEISDISPLSTILSGGLNISVQGTNLDVIARPRIGLKAPGSSLDEDNFSTETCTIDNGARSMTCPSPSAKNVSQDGKAEIFFLMDGVESLRNFSATHPELSVLKVHDDPVVRSVEKPSKNEDGRLKIDVTGLKGVVPKSQVVVTVGGSVCKNLTIAESYVSCDLKTALKKASAGKNKTAYSVVIRIGHLEVMVGKVDSVPTSNSTAREPGFFSTTNIIVIAVPVAVVLLCLGCCCWLRQGKGHNHNCSHDVYSMSSNTEMVAFRNKTGIVDPEKIRLVENSGLLIKRDHLQLGDCVGEGNFGCVYVGHLDRQGTKTKVAVKTLRDEDSPTVNLNEFVEEALLMKDFKHPHVMNLMGIAFGEESLPLVVLPFMERGDLRSFIADWRNDLTVLDVIKFGRDIASGMAYLSGLKFVHRDLAARNCMLESDLRVRVADFGLCRDIYEKGYYHSDNKKKLPIRWMSIESIEAGTYSTKSDVWSLGVVLWELFTRGVTPYPGVDGWDIARFLRAGRRLEQPWFCPSSVYEVMLSCWMEEPSSRPSFLDVQELLEKIYAIQESNVDRGAYVTLGECARYQNVAELTGEGSYYVLETSSNPPSSTRSQSSPTYPLSYPVLPSPASLPDPDLPPPPFPEPAPVDQPPTLPFPQPSCPAGQPSGYITASHGFPAVPQPSAATVPTPASCPAGQPSGYITASHGFPAVPQPSAATVPTPASLPDPDLPPPPFPESHSTSSAVPPPPEPTSTSYLAGHPSGYITATHGFPAVPQPSAVPASPPSTLPESQSFTFPNALHTSSAPRPQLSTFASKTAHSPVPGSDVKVARAKGKGERL